MQNFNDSWNFGLGIQGGEKFSQEDRQFDILDNDYIQIHGLELRDENDG